MSAGLPSLPPGTLERPRYGLLIGNSVENEARVFDARAKLPDGCVRELQPGDVGAYMVVRVADEIVVDLMASASGIDYDEASRDIVWRELEGGADSFCLTRFALAHEASHWPG